MTDKWIEIRRFFCKTLNGCSTVEGRFRVKTNWGFYSFLVIVCIICTLTLCMYIGWFPTLFRNHPVYLIHFSVSFVRFLQNFHSFSLFIECHHSSLLVVPIWNVFVFYKYGALVCSVFISSKYFFFRIQKKRDMFHVRKLWIQMRVVRRYQRHFIHLQVISILYSQPQQNLTSILKRVLCSTFTLVLHDFMT